MLKRSANVLSNLEECTSVLAHRDAHLNKSFGLLARNEFRKLKQKGTRYFRSKICEKELE